MSNEKYTKYKFEILMSSADDPMLAAGAYYVSIRDRVGTPLVDTYLSHRFLSVSDARIAEMEAEIAELKAAFRGKEEADVTVEFEEVVEQEEAAVAEEAPVEEAPAVEEPAEDAPVEE